MRCQTLGPEADWQEIAIASDGQHIAARTGAGTVRLIATIPWHEVAQIASPLGVLDAAAFAPDGQTLAVLSAEMGEVSVWRAADGTRVASFAAPPASTIDAIASSLAYSSDGTRLATSLGALINVSSGAVTSWKTGAPINTSLVVNPENLDLGEAVPEITFTAGDSTLFVDTLYQIGNSPPSTRLELRDAGDRTADGAVRHLLARAQRLCAVARSPQAGAGRSPRKAPSPASRPAWRSTTRSPARC